VARVGLCVRLRKNRVTPALTPALSLRRGSATNRPRLIQASSSAFSPLGNNVRTFGRNERGDLRSRFQGDSTCVPSPGAAGEASAKKQSNLGQSEGGPSSQSLSFL
jgi:hypothetical protein